MKFYLAARYSRREELCRYRDQLKAAGYAVTSRWLNGKHQIDNSGKPIGDNGESLVEDGSGDYAATMRQHFAQEDVADVLAADVLIAFTEVPRSGHSRGGRHVELGLALGTNRRVIVVGPRENVFCWLPQVEHFEEWYGQRGALHVVTGHSFCGAPCGACGDVEGCHRWQSGVEHYGTLITQYERTGRV